MNSVCYGDLVYIETKNLVLFTNGFYDSKLYLVDSKNMSSRSFRNGLFKIIPNQEIDGLDAKQVRYGQRIHLRHVESQLFVGLKKAANYEDKSFIQLELTKQRTEENCFVFLSKAESQGQGEPVQYDSPTKIALANSGACFSEGLQLDLSTVRTELNPSDNKITKNNEDSFPDIPSRRREPVFESSVVHHLGMKMADAPEDTYLRRFFSNQEEEKEEDKKALRNGDYLRIKNGKLLYLTAYKKMEAEVIFFQGFNSQMDYQYNKVATLFQILEASDKEELPQGNLLVYDESKRYVLKHVVSGQYLTCREEEISFTANKDEIVKFAILAKDKLKGHYICRGDSVELRFYSANDELQGTLTLGESIKIQNVQLEVNTWLFYGFQRPENYLNKFLRAQRRKVVINEPIGEEKSSVKLLAPSSEETVAIFLVESLANSVQRFIDFLDNFIYKSKGSFDEFKEEVKRIGEICHEFAQQSHEENQNEKLEDILNPESTKKALLREFQVYDLFYRIFYYLIEDQGLSSLLKGFVTVPTTTVDGNNEEENFTKDILSLLTAIHKIMMISFDKNDLNRYYCSQFVRISILCSLSPAEIFKLGTHHEYKLSMKELMLALLEQGLWDKDLDALGQLNYYETPVFDAIRQQESYHTIYLRIMKHISNSKAPNLKNSIRDNFIFNFLQMPKNMLHIFPALKIEDGQLSIQFTRLEHANQNKTIVLNSLSPKHIDDPQEETLMKYFLESLYLAISLASADSQLYELKIVEHYTYDNLTKVVNLLKDIPRYREVRTAIAELLAKIHQGYLTPLFTKLPYQVQILDRNDTLRSVMLEINNDIENASATVLSPSELEYIKTQGLEGLIEDLRSKTMSENRMTQLVKVLDSYQGKDEDVLEDIGKMLESNQEVDFDTFSKARGIVVTLLNEAVELRENADFDLVKRALTLFGTLEAKAHALAAIDVMTKLKEMTINNTINAGSFSKIIETCVREWKTGERFQASLENKVKINEVYRSMDTMKILNILYELFLSSPEHLKGIIIQQIKTVSSFESLLYKELNKLAVVYDQGSLEKTCEIVKITFKLNEIGREIYFCQDSGITSSEQKEEKLLEEIIEHMWTLFFIIYDPTLHFKDKRSMTDPKERFKEAFMTTKKTRWDKCFKLRPEAVNKPFQKIFAILSTYKALIKTQNWVLQKKTGFEEEFERHKHIIMLNILILTAFVQGNKENQMLMSNLKGIIGKFYDQHYIDQTADCMLLFSEMMRDNYKLLKLSTKYLYDITMSTFVGTLNRSIHNGETNGYLCAAISNFHYLDKTSVFNAISDMKTKWGEVGNVESFTSLRIVKNEQVVFPEPYCYYSIRALMEETLGVVKNYPSRTQFEGLFELTGWLAFLESENYLFQYELKNLLTRCLSKIYFESEPKNQLIKTNEDCVDILACLAADILHYVEYRGKSQNASQSPLKTKLENCKLITENNKYTEIQKLYEEVSKIELDKFFLEISGENVALEYLLAEYVFGGCLELLFTIILREVNHCKESVVDLVLALTEELIVNDYENPLFPHEKVKNFLLKLSGMEGYNDFRQRIIMVTELLNEKLKKKEAEEAEKKKISEETGLIESYVNYDILKNSSKVYKEQNIRQAADTIADYPNSKLIVRGILKYMKKHPSKLKTGEIIFILKLLRKYIERENSSNQPVYMWKEASASDLKKIETVQQLYKEEGLGDILFIFFTSKDTKVLSEVMLLSQAYRYGGSKEIEDDFSEKLKEYEDLNVATFLTGNLNLGV